MTRVSHDCLQSSSVIGKEADRVFVADSRRLYVDIFCYYVITGARKFHKDNANAHFETRTERINCK